MSMRVNILITVESWFCDWIHLSLNVGEEHDSTNSQVVDIIEQLHAEVYHVLQPSMTQ